jgi:hypothetical protein
VLFAGRRFKDAAPQREPPLTIPHSGAILRQMSRFSVELWYSPAKPTPSQKKEAIRRRSQGATLDELARSYNVSRATISRLAV